ncbi:MAG: hypothetical protein FWC68_02440, partial [Oscillospiraceae bacterium]|nr:hypothetical protein [Oscillospiraceae bacterium]
MDTFEEEGILDDGSNWYDGLSPKRQALAQDLISGSITIEEVIEEYGKVPHKVLIAIIKFDEMQALKYLRILKDTEFDRERLYELADSCKTKLEEKLQRNYNNRKHGGSKPERRHSAGMVPIYEGKIGKYAEFLSDIQAESPELSFRKKVVYHSIPREPSQRESEPAGRREALISFYQS